MGKQGNEGAPTKGTIWPQMLGGRVDAAVQALVARSNRRFAVSLLGSTPSTDWRSACGNCGNFPDCATIRAFTPGRRCAALIGVTLAEIAEIRRGLHPVGETAKQRTGWSSDCLSLSGLRVKRGLGGGGAEPLQSRSAAPAGTRKGFEVARDTP